MPARARRCICVRASADWLFDTGSARDYERFLRDDLHSRGIDRLDGLVFSHGDSLHLGGALAVLAEFRPRRVIDNGAPDRSSVHRDLIVRLKRTGNAVRDGFPLFTAMSRPRVLYPADWVQAKAADDQALVVQLIVDGKFRVLLVFDSGLTTESALLHYRPNELRSDILIKGQHSLRRVRVGRDFSTRSGRN